MAATLHVAHGMETRSSYASIFQPIPSNASESSTSNQPLTSSIDQILDSSIRVSTSSRIPVPIRRNSSSPSSSAYFPPPIQPIPNFVAPVNPQLVYDTALNLYYQNCMYILAMNAQIVAQSKICFDYMEKRVAQFQNNYVSICIHPTILPFAPSSNIPFFLTVIPYPLWHIDWIYSSQPLLICTVTCTKFHSKNSSIYPILQRLP